MVAQLNIGFPLSANCSRANVLTQESKLAGQASRPRDGITTISK
jgi:hypothetical protein